MSDVSDVSETNLGLGGDMSDDSDDCNIPPTDDEAEDPNDVPSDNDESKIVSDAKDNRAKIEKLMFKSNTSTFEARHIADTYVEGANQVGIIRCHGMSNVVPDAKTLTALHKTSDPDHTKTWKERVNTIQPSEVIVVMAYLKPDPKNPDIDTSVPQPHWYISFRVASKQSDDRLLMCHIPKSAYTKLLTKFKAMVPHSGLHNMIPPNQNMKPINGPINTAKALNVNDGSGFVKVDITLDSLVISKPKPEKKVVVEPSSPVSTSARSSPPNTPIKKVVEAKPKKPVKTPHTMLLAASDKKLAKEAAAKAKAPEKKPEQEKKPAPAKKPELNGETSDVPQKRKRDEIEVKKTYFDVSKKRVMVELDHVPAGGDLVIIARYGREL